MGLTKQVLKSLKVGLIRNTIYDGMHIRKKCGEMYKRPTNLHLDIVAETDRERVYIIIDIIKGSKSESLYGTTVRLTTVLNNIFLPKIRSMLGGFRYNIARLSPGNPPQGVEMLELVYVNIGLNLQQIIPIHKYKYGRIISVSV